MTAQELTRKLFTNEWYVTYAPSEKVVASAIEEAVRDALRSKCEAVCRIVQEMVRPKRLAGVLVNLIRVVMVGDTRYIVPEADAIPDEDREAAGI